MDIFMAILMALNTYVFADGTTRPDDEQAAQIIMDNHWYQEREGGVIVDSGVSV